MRTVHCSGHPSCYVHPLAMHAPLHHTCPPLPCMPSFATHAPLCHAHPHLPHMPPFAMHAPLPPWTDRHLWKHYLSATTVADGNKWQIISCDHYPRHIGLHHTWNPPPSCRAPPHQYRTPPAASDIWWPRLENCSNLLTWGPLSLTVVTSGGWLLKHIW